MAPVQWWETWQSAWERMVAEVREQLQTYFSHEYDRAIEERKLDDILGANAEKVNMGGKASQYGDPTVGAYNRIESDKTLALMARRRNTIRLVLKNWAADCRREGEDGSRAKQYLGITWCLFRLQLTDTGACQRLAIPRATYFRRRREVFEYFAIMLGYTNPTELQRIKEGIRHASRPKRRPEGKGRC